MQDYRRLNMSETADYFRKKAQSDVAKESAYILAQRN